MSVELIGPLIGREHTYRVAVEGFRVPWVKVVCWSPVRFDIRITGRMCWEFDGDRHQLDQVLRIVANALAIGAGFTCFGENRRKNDDFGVRVIRIDDTISGPEEP